MAATVGVLKQIFLLYHELIDLPLIIIQVMIVIIQRKILSTLRIMSIGDCHNPASSFQSKPSLNPDAVIFTSFRKQLVPYRVWHSARLM